MSIKNHSCIICGKKSTETVKQIKDLAVVICKNDGHIFLQSRPSKEEYNEKYKLYQDKSGRHDQQTDVWNKLKNHTVIPEKPIILDIGTGYTHLPAYLETIDQDFTYYGIEINPEYIRQLEEMGVAIIDTDVYSDSWAVEGKNMFDIVIVRQVLDHFADPLEILKNVWTVLALKGVVFVSVTDIMKDKKDKRFIGSHIHYFSKETLNHIASKAKLKMVADGYNGDSEYWAIYSKGRAAKSKFTSVYEEQKAFLLKKDEDIEPES